MADASDPLREAFGDAAPEHLAWQTTAPFVSDRERELVRAAFLPLGKRVLDLGCGEGATLVHVEARPGSVGVDLFEPKLVLARKILPACRFVAASADSLPFADRSFDHVLVRDVVHHLDDPRPSIDEIARVLEPGGRLDVLEPCRYNPLIAMHAISQRAERGELRSTPKFLESLILRRFRVIETRRHQAMPLHRLVFHPRFGSSRLASDDRAQRVVRALEAFAEKLVPPFAWAYIHVRAERTPGS